MPIIDLSEEQESPEAGPSRLDYASDSRAARQARRPRRQPSSEGEVELVSNISRQHARRNPRRQAQVDAGQQEQEGSRAERARRRRLSEPRSLSLHLPSRPDHVFVNLADEPENSAANAPVWTATDDDDDSYWGNLGRITRGTGRFYNRLMGFMQSAQSTPASTLTIRDEAPIWTSSQARNASHNSSSTTSVNASGALISRGGYLRSRAPNSRRPETQLQVASAEPAPTYDPFMRRWAQDHLLQNAMNGNLGLPISYATAAASLPPPKYDINESHPRKLARGFRRDVVPPAPVIDLDKTIDADADSEEEEEVPVCAACKTELFVPQMEGDKSASRPCALKCGHIICAGCVYTGRKFFRKQIARKRKANLGYTTNAKSKTRKVSAASQEKDIVLATNGNGNVNPEEHGIVSAQAGLEPGEWIGCPVPSCDGGGTQWLRNLGHPDGLWEIYLNVD